MYTHTGTSSSQCEHKLCRHFSRQPGFFALLCYFQCFTSKFSACIGWRKYLYECMPFWYVNLWISLQINTMALPYCMILYTPATIYCTVIKDAFYSIQGCCIVRSIVALSYIPCRHGTYAEAILNKEYVAGSINICPWQNPMWLGIKLKVTPRDTPGCIRYVNCVQ